jgi:hypothetical protein
VSTGRRVTARVFAQVKPTFGTRYDSAQGQHLPTVTSITIVSTTKSRSPAKAGCVVVELKLDFPEQAFLPLQPTAVITIPDNFVGLDTIEIEALDPTDMNDDQVAAYLASQGRQT